MAPAGSASPSPSASPTNPLSKLGDIFKPKNANNAPAGNARSNSANATPAPGGGNGQVWVNTETKVYHKEGSRFYGKTKQGKYMTEEEARKAGYRAAARNE